MIRKLALAVSLVAAAGVAQAQMKKPPQADPTSPIQIAGASAAPNIPLANAKRIDRDEAMRMVAKGDAVFVDVRSTQTYAKAHIRGAISIPQSKLAERLSQVPPGKFLITYCACQQEHTAAMAVLFYNKHGITKVAALRDGWNGWLAARMPIEGWTVR